MKSIVIYGGSGGSESKTWKIALNLGELLNATTIINLLNFKIGTFDYDHRHQDDDFKNIIEKILEMDHIIFVTPVYWYSMTGQLKIFLDRFNDLTSLRKSWGKSLKGKSLAFIATGSQDQLPLGFEIPFQGLANYFDMNFQGYTYLSTHAQVLNESYEKDLKEFVNLLLNKN